jgi:hypothetical protein
MNNPEFPYKKFVYCAPNVKIRSSAALAVVRLANTTRPIIAATEGIISECLKMIWTSESRSLSLALKVKDDQIDIAIDTVRDEFERRTITVRAVIGRLSKAILSAQGEAEARSAKL